MSVYSKKLNLKNIHQTTNDTTGDWLSNYVLMVYGV